MVHHSNEKIRLLTTKSKELMLKKITFFTTVLTVLFSMSVISVTANNVTKVEVMKGEKWWGVFVSNAPVEPFLKPFKINTADSPAVGFYRPVLLSNNGRFIWSSEPMQIEFTGEQIIITSEQEKVNVQKGGKNLREAYLVSCHKYFPPTGKMPDISLFTLPQYDTSLELGFVQDQQTVLDYAERIRSEGLPAGIIVIPNGWSSQKTPYSFSPELYPDPAAMLDKLHSMGFKVMLTITPYVPAYGREYAAGLQRDYFLRSTDGTPYIIETKGGFATAYDMADQEQAEFVKNAVNELKSRYNIDGFRFDCRNVTSYLAGDKNREADYMKAWAELSKGDTYLAEFLPAIGTSDFPHISGIEISEEAAGNFFVSAINDMISAGLTGFPYSSVMSMTENNTELFSDAALMAKFLQLEAAMPVMRISFAPWRVKDTKYYKAVVEAISFRNELRTYIAELVSESSKTAEPLMRHMEYQFPKSGFHDCNDQFMLGAKYLFAPNTGSASKRMVRIPKGMWTDRDGNRVKGPVVKEVDCSDGRIVYFKLTGK